MGDSFKAFNKTWRSFLHLHVREPPMEEHTPVDAYLFTCPAAAVYSCAPVTPQAVVFLLGSNLDQVFLTRNGISDQEGALILDVVYLRTHTVAVTHITGSLILF